MQKNNLIKRYFLWFVGLYPSVATILLGGAGFTAGLVALLILAPQPQEVWLILGLPLGLTGVGAVVGVISSVVCRLFVSSCNEPGAFFAYEVLTVEGWPTRGKLLAAAFSRLWFPKRKKGTEIRWLGLPFTGRRRQVKLSLGPFPVSLEVVFGGDFDLEEVSNKIVRRGDHEGFDEWLSSLVLEVSETSRPVQQVLRQISRRPPGELLLELKAPLKMALEDAGFPQVLRNIEGIEFTLCHTRTSIERFNLA